MHAGRDHLVRPLFQHVLGRIEVLADRAHPGDDVGALVRVHADRLAARAMPRGQEAAKPVCYLVVAVDELDAELRDLLVVRLGRVGRREQRVEGDPLPFRPLNQDPRLAELRRVHAVIPVEVGLDEGIDVVEAEPPLLEMLLDRLHVDDVCEALPCEHEGRLVAADVPPVVVRGAAGVDEDVPSFALDQPGDVRNVDLLAEVVHVGEAALLPLRSKRDDHRRDRVHERLTFRDFGFVLRSCSRRAPASAGAGRRARPPAPARLPLRMRQRPA